MARTVTGLFDTLPAADRAVQELLRKGFPTDAISVIANASDGSQAQVPSPVGPDVARSTAEGVGAGAVVGLLLGLVAIPIALPGAGLVLAAGPLALLLGGAGVGATAGGLIGVLSAEGVSHQMTHALAEGVRRGGVLVTVRAGDEQVEAIEESLMWKGAADLEDRVAEWQKDGWSPPAEVFKTAEVSKMEASRS